MDRTLYLFPDTNLFIQCRALKELDWSHWSDFSEIHLIVSRPVQREIDSQKNRGNDRIGRRALKAYKLFRRILLKSDHDYLLVHEAVPQVKLFLAGPGKPSSELMDVLDYTKADDELVGYMWEYQNQDENRDVRLLTHDSGPMMTAKAIDLPFIPIPDSWLLPPEPNKAEQEIRRLNEQINQLKAGPKFEIAFLDQHRNEIRDITTSLQIPLPLSETEIDALTLTLKRKLPQLNWFLPNLNFDQGCHDRLYQKWIGRCREAFANLHKGLQMESRGIIFSIMAANTGVSPARDVLVEIETKGKFLALPFRESDEFESGKWRVSLPQPPKPMDSLGFDRAYSESLMLPHGLDGNYPRDANAFYYKPTRPVSPVTSHQIECVQWRHGLDSMYFDCEVFVGQAIDENRGVIECTIHADNLPTPAKAHVLVRIEVEGVKVVDRAKDLIANLKDRE